MPPRSYDLGRRQGASDATRGKILDATRSLIGGKGEPGEFSMDAVAARAGVARMTVYNQFGSQAGLLEALADRLAERGGMHRLAGAFMAPRADEAIRIFVGTFVAFWASERLLLRRLRAMGVLLPGLYRGVRDRDQWRREGARNLLAKIGGSALGAARSDADWSTDLLATMTSFEVFDNLCTEGRSPDVVAAEISETLIGLWALAPRAAARRPRRPAPPSR